MKRWQIVYALPLEVWVDIFSHPWITRAEFGQLVDRIGNFKFAEHAQFFLHEWGKRKLPFSLFFEKDGLFKFVEYKRLYLDVPTTPLPANIRSFETIRIGHFDAKIADFLAKIGPLLTNVQLWMTCVTTDCLESPNHSAPGKLRHRAAAMDQGNDHQWTRPD